jgi:hypothetical protein
MRGGMTGLGAACCPRQGERKAEREIGRAARWHGGVDRYRGELVVVGSCERTVEADDWQGRL